MDTKLTGSMIGAGATLLAACIWVWGGKLTGDDKKPAAPGGGAPTAASVPASDDLRRQLDDERRKMEAERRTLEAERRSLAEAELAKIDADRRRLEDEHARLLEANRVAQEKARLERERFDEELAKRREEEAAKAEKARAEKERKDAEPANFSGVWVTALGEHFTMVQAGNRVQFRGVDDEGATVAGEGVVTGREVVIEYVRADETSRSSGKATLKLSADGKQASGIYTNDTFGERGTMVLKRP